ncbi:MAG: DUF2231 domain-containing protein [Clostridia bacterium]
MINGMPLHPMIVHFPVALLLVGVLIQILAIWRPEPLDRAATYLFAGGVVTGIAAYLTGDAGEEYAEQFIGGNLESMIEPHENLALASLILFGIIVVIKLLPQLQKLRKTLLPLILIASLVGGGMIAYTGHLGGKIVYQGTTPQQTVGGDNDND